VEVLQGRGRIIIFPLGGPQDTKANQLPDGRMLPIRMTESLMNGFSGQCDLGGIKIIQGRGIQIVAGYSSDLGFDNTPHFTYFQVFFGQNGSPDHQESARSVR